jgi:hypothetical protein
MALARVVSFSGVSSARAEEMKQQINEGEQPEDIPATEMIMLHDPTAEEAMAILFFDNEEDYRRADAALDAMPADETPGRRSAVKKFDVTMRMESSRR